MSIKTPNLLVLVFFLISAQVHAQQTVLEKDVKQQEQQTINGPNKKHYRHWYLNAGNILGYGNQKGFTNKNGSSFFASMGYRYKYKITNHFSSGAQIYYTHRRYSLKQLAGTKIYPTIGLHQYEHIRLNNLGINWFWRTNFGKRGNAMGKYLDVGIYGEWIFNANHQFKDVLDKANIYGSYNQFVKNRYPNYLTDGIYGLSIRLGSGRWAITGDWKASNLIVYSKGWTDMAAFTVGIEIGIY